MFDILDLQESMPKIGDKVKRIPNFMIEKGMTKNRIAELRIIEGTVVDVNKDHLWYTVEYPCKNGIAKESYKVPDIPIVGEFFNNHGLSDIYRDKKYCVCENCGKTFMCGRNRRLLLCDICLKETSNRRYYLNKKKKDAKKDSAILKICRDLEKYNKKHHTLLTYGQYVAKINA